MIYFENIRTQQDILIPSNGLSEGLVRATFTLRSTISAAVVFSTPADIETDGTYYRLIVSLPASIQSGEYAYRLAFEGKTLASGLCQVGDYRRGVISQGEGGFSFKQAK